MVTRRNVMKSLKMVLSLFALSLIFTQYSLATDYTGMWWDQSKPGTGVFIDFTEGPNTVCGSWYLYDDRGYPMWVTFWGIVENGALSADLYRFTGPAMGHSWNNDAVRSESVGNIKLNFKDSGHIAMTYEIERHGGTFDLTRFSTDSCVGSLWWDLQKQGQGVSHVHFKGPSTDELTGIVWYVYDKDGNGIWYTAVGPTDAETFDALTFTGPPLGQPWDASLVKSQKAGTITASFDVNAFKEQNTPKIDFLFDIQGVSGKLDLVPFECPVAVPGR